MSDGNCSDTIDIGEGPLERVETPDHGDIYRRKSQADKMRKAFEHDAKRDHDTAWNSEVAPSLDGILNHK